MAKVTFASAKQSSATPSRAVASSLQARLSVSQVHDPYEQEADRVADSVVNSSPTGGITANNSATAAAPVTGSPSISRLVNRKVVEKGVAAEEKEEERESKVQREAEKEEPQAKLQRAEEKEEPQAKLQRAAEKEEPQAKLQRAEEKEEPQAKLQRAEEKEEPQAKLQRAAENEEPQAKLQRAAEKEEPQAKLQHAEEKEEPQAKLQRAEEKEEPQAKLQRAEEKEGPQAKLQRAEEKEEPQAKLQRAAEKEEPQTKLQREAEKEEPQPKLQRQEEKGEEEAVQAKNEARANRRDKKLYPELNEVEEKLFANKGKGEKMDDEARIDMETGFGADFSAVRIHTGGDAVAMNRSLKAQAFTHGKDVFFNSGKYEPASLTGKLLLAHELTHVVQQGGAEQKVTDEKVAQNNATRNQPVPEPTDKQAKIKEEETSKKIQAQEPLPGEKGEAKQAELPAKDEEKTGKEGDAAKEKKPGEEEKKAGAKKALKGKGKTKAKKGKGKGKGKKGGGVGAYLREVTQAAFGAKSAKISQLATNEKKKESPETKLAQSEKSVVPPAQESQSRASAQQVETVDKVEQPKPDEKKAKQGLDDAMGKAVPKTLEEVDEFKEEGKGRVVGQAVKEVVSTDSQEVKATYQEIENTPAPAPAAQPEVLPEVEEAPETEPLDMGDGMVGEVKTEHTDMSEFDNESDNLMEKEGIKDEHLDMVDEGDLAEAKKDRKEVKKTVKEGPKEVKTLEQKQKQQVNKELTQEEQAGRQQMREQRKQQLMGAQADQKKTKSTIEEKRQKVTDHINGIYEKANTTVKQKLSDLEKKSLKDFDTGQAKATKAFEDNVNRRINAFKHRRYDRFGGSLLWAKDKLFGMDDLPEVKNIFDTEKASFITTIDALIATITKENKRVIQECKDLIANARAEIKKYVAGLGPELQKTGQDALKEMKGKLDALDKAVNDKEKELQKKLAEKREAAIKAIEEKIEKMKEAMSGLLGKLGNLLLNAMIKFFKWALKKAGYASDQLMGILNKGKAVIKKIVTDPIGFIGNIVKAVKGGINLFVTNIKKHLISGLIGWLTGAMADVPIQLPTKFDLKGILHLVLQILGLTWTNIRTKLVKRLGEKVVKIAETSVTIIKTLITEGPMGLWEMIKAKAAEIKQQVMDGIRNWVITQVVKQAIIKLLSFLNPAGAIVQAIIAIYNTIMFFVENWDRIVQFVKTVFSSIADIAMGKLSAAAQAVERVMAMTIPIILNFLARLLGLSGIGKAVSNVIKKIRKPIDKIVNKVIDKIVAMAKKLFKKGKAAAKKAAGKVKDIIFPKQKYKSGKEQHTIQVKKVGGKDKIIVRSVERNIPEFVKDAKNRAKKLDASTKQEVDNLTQILTSKNAAWVALPDTISKSTKKKKYKEITRFMIKVAQKTPDVDIPDSDAPVYYGETAVGGGQRAKRAEIPTLTMKNIPVGQNTNGREAVPGINTPGYESESNYRLHLIHHELGGVAESNKNNLVAGSKSSNERMRGNVENLTLEAVGKRGRMRSGTTSKGMPRLLNYKAEVTYDDSKAPNVAKKITVTATEKETGAVIGKHNENNY